MKFSTFLSLCLVICITSCNKEATKKEVQEQNELQTETVKDKIKGKDFPNIYVVKNNFPSKDNLSITADFYEVDEKPFTMLLCHQAGFSRGEYKDTALRLNELGYSVVAIDQRSGNSVNDIVNETAALAKNKKLPTKFLNARQDIEAAIDYIYTNNGNKPIIIVGSSYSASLVLVIGKNNPKVKAIAAFSPGEYIEPILVTNKLLNCRKPLFITSSKKEISQVTNILVNVEPEYVTHFKPTVEGIHGSRALWQTTEGNDAYWKAFISFLKSLKQI